MVRVVYPKFDSPRAWRNEARSMVLLLSFQKKKRLLATNIFASEKWMVGVLYTVLSFLAQASWRVRWYVSFSGDVFVKHADADQIPNHLRFIRGIPQSLRTNCQKVMILFPYAPG